MPGFLLPLSGYGLLRKANLVQQDDSRPQRLPVALAVLCSTALVIGCAKKEMTQESEIQKLKPVYSDSRGRILVGDSLTYVSTSYQRDVVVCGSFAGAPTIAIPLQKGVRGVIAHAAGVGKDEAGIAGLALANDYGVPAAAVETMSASIADGDSLYAGKVSHVNEAAGKLGAKPGMNTEEVAKLMLDARDGSPIDVASTADETSHEVLSTEQGKIIAVWSILLVDGQQPSNVFCVASHSGETMAKFAKRVMPKAIIANDAGKALGDSGIAGLTLLDEVGVAAASVDAMTARIGDGLSTYEDGVISATNEHAREAGVAVGMPAKRAALLLLETEN